MLLLKKKNKAHILSFLVHFYAQSTELTQHLLFVLVLSCPGLKMMYCFVLSLLLQKRDRAGFPSLPQE